MTDPATVYIVDDDPAVRDSLRWLIESLQYKVETFENAQSFLDACLDGSANSSIGCLVLDVRLPGMSGLHLQQKLNQENIKLPVIIITGHGDVPMAVRALQAGARHFLEKPFREQEILDCVQEAIDFSIRRSGLEQHHKCILDRIDLLTPRETQIMHDIVDGLTNKEMAEKNGISIKTIEIHRTRVMQKMQAASLADLVKMSVTVSI